MPSEATQNKPTVIFALIVTTARSEQVPNADWSNGMTGSGGSSGIGITYNTAGDTPLTEDPAKWTLLDQHGSGVARTPQLSQYIGGTGFAGEDDYPGSGGLNGWEGGSPLQFQDNGTGGDGMLDFLGQTDLITLAEGWVPVIV
jgi:hypothetical protein